VVRLHATDKTTYAGGSTYNARASFSRNENSDGPSSPTDVLDSRNPSHAYRHRPRFKRTKYIKRIYYCRYHTKCARVYIHTYIYMIYDDEIFRGEQSRYSEYPRPAMYIYIYIRRQLRDIETDVTILLHRLNGIRFVGNSRNDRYSPSVPLAPPACII